MGDVGVSGALIMPSPSRTSTTSTSVDPSPYYHNRKISSRASTLDALATASSMVSDSNAIVITSIRRRQQHSNDSMHRKSSHLVKSSEASHSSKSQGPTVGRSNSPHSPVAESRNNEASMFGAGTNMDDSSPERIASSSVAAVSTSSFSPSFDLDNKKRKVSIVEAPCATAGSGSHHHHPSGPVRKRNKESTFDVLGIVKEEKEEDPSGTVSVAFIRTGSNGASLVSKSTESLASKYGMPKAKGSSTEDDTSKIDEEEILTIVRDELTLNCDDKKIQGQNIVGQALLKLANLCDMSDRGKRNADFFLNTMGIGSIILLMKQAPTNPNIQGCGFALLLNIMNLSTKKCIKDAIKRMGGLEVIISAILALPQYEKVQLYGCALLQKWTKEENTDELRTLVNVCGAEAFVAAMKKNRKDIRIQRLGCKALCNICLQVEYLPRLRQAGAFSALIAAGEYFPNDPIASVSAANAARYYLVLTKGKSVV